MAPLARRPRSVRPRPALERRQHGERVVGRVERRVVLDERARQRLGADARGAAPAAGRAGARPRSASARSSAGVSASTSSSLSASSAAAASSPSTKKMRRSASSGTRIGCRQRWHSSVTSVSAPTDSDGWTAGACAGRAARRSRASRRRRAPCRLPAPAWPRPGACRRSAGQSPASSPPAAANAATSRRCGSRSRVEEAIGPV